MNKELEIALRYQPHIMFDEKEPFLVTGIGYTVFYESRQSVSFPKRKIIVDTKKMAYVIEYAVWYDYDIEHLYELEHLWIYVSLEGKVLHAEGSFHGKYLNMINPTTGDLNLEEETHLVVYAQPGKHAFLPEGNLVRLIPNWFESCNETAGSAGVLVQEMFSEQIRTDSLLQEQVEQYIKQHYSFEPTLRFQKKICSSKLFMTYDELCEMIPERVNDEITKIKAYYKK